MHALRRHQVATFTKEFTQEFKIVIAETTVSAFMQNQVASDANEPMHEKLFMKKDIQRTRQWNLPWLNMVKKKSTYSAVGHVKRNIVDITSFQNTTIIT